MITFEAAHACYAQIIRPLDVISLPISEALGYVLAESPVAVTDLPPFTQSAVDGYALHAEDVANASVEKPVVLDVIADIPAGPLAEIPPIASGQCVRILTGGSVPTVTDTVARQELTLQRAEPVAGKITLSAPIAKAQDTRFKGEELQKGAELAKPSQMIDVGLLSALSMAGVAEVKVYRKPKVTALITGDELLPPGTALTTGQVYDANGPQVAAFMQQTGFDLDLVYVPDLEPVVRERLNIALMNSDLIITTGGVSVGDKDFIPSVAEQLGMEQHFWKVAQMPGKPLLFTERDGVALLGLPGNPAAVLTCLHVHVLPVLQRMMGKGCDNDLGQPAFSGRLTEAIKPNKQRMRWVRMRQSIDVDGQVHLMPLSKQGSHMLSNTRDANVLVYVPAGTEQIDAGTRLQWVPLL